MHIIISLVARLLGWVEHVFLVVASSCLVVMLAGNAANIALRNVTGSGLSFVFPWTTVLFVWMNFLAFFVIYRRGNDISVKYFVERLGPRGQIFTWLLYQIVAIFVVSVILLEGPGILALQVGYVSEFVEIERYWLSVPFFLSCALVLLDIIITILHAILTREFGIRPKTASLN